MYVYRLQINWENLKKKKKKVRMELNLLIASPGKLHTDLHHNKLNMGNGFFLCKLFRAFCLNPEGGKK
jgi:hypothetical protein